MATVASQPPVVVASGSTPDMAWQPLNDCGAGNPLFYHTFSDDFDGPGTTDYTATGTGTAALTPAAGGAVLITALTTSFEYMQVINASFQANVLPKKVFFLTRFQLNTVATATAVAGLFATGANPISAAVNGVYFKWVGGTGLTLNVTVASATTSVTIPAAAYTMANATNIDMSINITRQGDVLGFVDTQLVGFIPQSNIGTTNGPQNAGAVARLTAPTLPSVLLTPTLGVLDNASGGKTLQADFLYASQER